jgi:S-methylmethionine-dependent homocysteine/selenocysteine methylase
MNPHDLLADPDRVLLLDGGMGQELHERGACEATPLWSAQALFDNPDMVGDLHADFVRAGADIIITNTYSTHPYRFAEFAPEVPVEEMIAEAVRQARRAAESTDREVMIAGSLPPFRSSYIAENVASYEELYPDYVFMAEQLAPHVDLLICETMTTLGEAVAAHAGARTVGLPVWVAWTLQNHGPDHLIDGTSYAEAVDTIDADAYLVNCTPPEVLEAALPQLVAVTDKPVGGYANAFAEIPEGWSMQLGDELLHRRDDWGATDFVAHTRRLIDAGARIVGGCCEIGPELMARIHDELFSGG